MYLAFVVLQILHCYVTFDATKMSCFGLIISICKIVKEKCMLLFQTELRIEVYLYG